MSTIEEQPAHVLAAFDRSNLGPVTASARRRLLRCATKRLVDPGVVVHPEGEPRPHVHLVVSGLIRMFVAAVDGRTVTVRYCRVGSLIGVASLFRRSFRLPVCVEAVTSIRLAGIEGIPTGTALSTSRRLLEEGREDLEGTLEFASWGSPAFDEVLAHFGGFEAPSGIRRLGVEDPDTGVRRIAYAVAASSEAGLTVRLVRSWQDLQGLVVDEQATIPHEQLEPLEQQLRRLLKQELALSTAVRRVERENESAAAEHHALLAATTRSLLVQRQESLETEDRFWYILNDLEGRVWDKDFLLVPSIPLDLVQQARRHLLFEPIVPKMGDAVTLRAPQCFVRSAIELACRAADATKVKKSELTLQRVLQRLGQ